MKIAYSVTIVAFFTTCSRVLGFVRDMLIAAYLGAGSVADAFFVSFSLPNLFRRLFSEGAFNAAFVPTFSRILDTKGIASAQKMAERLLSLFVFVGLGIVIIVEIFMPEILSLLMPGLTQTPERFHLAVFFSRVTFPYLLLISLAALFGGILNAMNRFGSTAATPMLLNISMTLSLVVAGNALETPGHALVWGVLIGGVAQCIWLYFSTRRPMEIFLKVRPPILAPSIRELLRLMIPGAIGAGVMQANLFIDVVCASLLPEGSVSFLLFADRPNQLPLSLTGTAISMVLLPILARHIQRQQNKEALHIQNRALEYGLLLVVPAAAAYMCLANPIIAVLFERGAFGAEQSKQTAYVLMAFACGLPGYVISKIFSTSLFACFDSKTPMVAAGISVGTNVCLNMIFLFLWGHIGIAIATSIASWVNALVLSYGVHRAGLLKLDTQARSFLPKLILSCAVMVGFLLLSITFLETILSEGEWKRMAALFGIIFGGLVIFTLSASLIGAVNFSELKSSFKKHPSEET